MTTRNIFRKWIVPISLTIGGSLASLINLTDASTEGKVLVSFIGGLLAFLGVMALYRNVRVVCCPRSIDKLTGSTDDTGSIQEVFLIMPRKVMYRLFTEKNQNSSEIKDEKTFDYVLSIEETESKLPASVYQQLNG